MMRCKKQLLFYEVIFDEKRIIIPQMTTFFPENLNLFIGSVIFGHQGFVKYQFVTVGIFKV